ncbi:LarC family nickel insertion protein [Ktedonospora formicarum]|uniref:UPF0272 protein n=1 Tax=Ktedonospora formicarum TaxID=2778364 RepID=A0A8J3ICH1_9CHLR|nr:LarC family nickel insertion protein [Ktedonospora formicarum]GHO50137.1 UPF0272 protein [Ktedonospora formicarum]
MTSNMALLDCSLGISGPLFLGALVDAGLDVAHLNKALSALPSPLASFTITAHKEYKTVSGTLVRIDVGEQAGLASWRLATTEALLERSALPECVRRRVLAIVERMAQIVGRTRGILPEDVTLPRYEWLVILIAVTLGVDMLKLERVYATPLPMLTGSYVSEDGERVPLVSPETVALLASVQAPWRMAEGAVELISLEGAALLAELATFEHVPSFVITGAGYGLTPQHSGSLRLCLGYLQEAQKISTENREGLADTDEVTVIETNIDNMSGELLGALMDHLLTLGALDVSYTPMQMKKNRPATLVRVIGKPEDGERLSMALLHETTTLGVRMQRMQRLKARREQRSLQTPLGPLLVKVKLLGDQILSAAPEYEECARLAREQGVPLAQVYDVAQHAVRTLIIGYNKE